MKSNPARILLVDDMPAMRSILRGMLSDLGFTQVTEVEDGEVAWNAIQSSIKVSADSSCAFDLVIADWNMPEMNGVDLLRSIRNYAPTRELPFFMITARGDGKHITQAQSAGVSGYLVKPFQVDDLKVKLTKFL